MRMNRRLDERIDERARGKAKPKVICLTSWYIHMCAHAHTHTHGVKPGTWYLAVWCDNCRNVEEWAQSSHLRKEQKTRVFYLLYAINTLNFIIPIREFSLLRTIGMWCERKSTFSALTLNTHPIPLLLVSDAAWRGRERWRTSNALKLDSIVISKRLAKLYLIIYR